MKSPDEIKKGMHCCSEPSYNCNECPYVDEPASSFCKITRTKDALEYIKQLEALNAELLKRVEMLPERDEELKDIKKGCFTCKHSYLNNPGIDICPYVDECDVSDSHWEWRGPQKENH